MASISFLFQDSGFNPTVTLSWVICLFSLDAFIVSVCLFVVFSTFTLLCVGTLSSLLFNLRLYISLCFFLIISYYILKYLIFLFFSLGSSYFYIDLFSSYSLLSDAFFCISHLFLHFHSSS